jgi:hypothetical protein
MIWRAHFRGCWGARRVDGLGVTLSQGGHLPWWLSVRLLNK